MDADVGGIESVCLCTDGTNDLIRFLQREADCVCVCVCGS